MGGRRGRIFHPLYIDSDNLVELTLTDARTESDIDTGTVTMTLYDEDDVVVTGAENIALSAVGSDGEWYGYIPDTISLTEGDCYYLIITITDGTYVLKDKRWYEACYYPNTETEEL